MTSVEELPPDLPVPEDDGAADHLPGMTVPRLELPTTDGYGVDLAEALGLPTFEAEGIGRLYKRLTFIARAGRIENVFYPVFPPNSDAPLVVEWLTRQS